MASNSFGVPFGDSQLACKNFGKGTCPPSYCMVDQRTRICVERDNNLADAFDPSPTRGGPAPSGHASHMPQHPASGHAASGHAASGHAPAGH